MIKKKFPTLEGNLLQIILVVFGMLVFDQNAVYDNLATMVRRSRSIGMPFMTNQLPWFDALNR